MMVNTQNAFCLTCGGLIMEPGQVYGYVGPVCHCAAAPRIQRRSDELDPIQPAPNYVGEILRLQSELNQAVYMQDKVRAERDKAEARADKYQRLHEHLEISSATDVQIIAEVWSFFNDSKKAWLWLRTKNPNLGGTTPANMMACGRSKKLLAWIQTQAEFNGPKKTS